MSIFKSGFTLKINFLETLTKITHIRKKAKFKSVQFYLITLLNYLNSGRSKPHTFISLTPHTFT